MARARTYRGEMTQGDTPKWQPLLEVVGKEVTGDFMWMFEVELSDGTQLQAYKHIDTRRYVHLAADGTAFVYEPPDRYRPFHLARVLAAVFRPLIGLAGVTAELTQTYLGAESVLRPAAERPPWLRLRGVLARLLDRPKDLAERRDRR